MLGLPGWVTGVGAALAGALVALLVVALVLRGWLPAPPGMVGLLRRRAADVLEAERRDLARDVRRLGVRLALDDFGSVVHPRACGPAEKRCCE